MTISKTINGNEAVFALEGRLDTMTAPQLEAELKSVMPEIKALTLDFVKLEYISSAGLRVLLTAQKTMTAKEGTMVVCNVNETVAEVFDVTGFADILTIK